MESRPCTDEQLAFMDDLGIAHFDEMTTKQASDLIDAELEKETPDGPATSTQIAIIRSLAAAAHIPLTISSSPTRRDAACLTRRVSWNSSILSREGDPTNGRLTPFGKPFAKELLDESTPEERRLANAEAQMQIANVEQTFGSIVAGNGRCR